MIVAKALQFGNMHSPISAFRIPRSSSGFLFLLENYSSCFMRIPRIVLRHLKDMSACLQESVYTIGKGIS